ncbi:MAG: hypothetical protein SFX73_02310 [Kofleriaceae bacterium]|nr:hypothetical protein [Kofleriaceae bacterium]
MRKLLALVVVFSLGACASRSSQRLGIGVGGAIASLGTVVAGSAIATQCPPTLEGLGCSIGTAFGASMGVSTMLLGGLILGVSLASDPPPDAPEAVSVQAIETVLIPQPPTTHPQLARLTRQASMMARREQCAGVVAVAREVELIDASYRTQGFVADASIANCLPE